MSMTIDPVKKAVYKRFRKRGLTKKESLLKAGYTPVSAQGQALSMIDVAESELQHELKAKDINVDWLIKKTSDIMEKADTKSDITNLHRGVENIARFVGIDKQQQVTNIWNLDVNGADVDLLTRMAKRRNSIQQTSVNK